MTAAMRARRGWDSAVTSDGRTSSALKVATRRGLAPAGIGTEADGLFPRDPEPTAANLKDLGRLVKESGADVGFAVDPDVDRLSLVDERGRPVGEDLTLALASAVVLKRTPGPVVTNLSTSRVVEDVAEGPARLYARPHDLAIAPASDGWPARVVAAQQRRE